MAAERSGGTCALVWSAKPDGAGAFWSPPLLPQPAPRPRFIIGPEYTPAGRAPTWYARDWLSTRGGSPKDCVSRYGLASRDDAAAWCEARAREFPETF